MLLLLVCSLLVGSVLGDTKRALIVIHESVRNAANMKNAMLRAFESHIKKADFVSIAVSNRIVLDWTPSSDAEVIRDSLAHLPLKHVGAKACRDSTTDYGQLLQIAQQHPCTEIVLIVDNLRDSGNVQSNTLLAHTLSSSGIKVYPIGVGPCIRDNELKRIAGPCNGFFGCVAPFSFFHAKDYNNIHRSISKDMIEPEEGLSTTEIVLTIVISSLVGLLALWCLVYSCWYVPAQVRNDFDVGGIQSSIVAPRPRIVTRKNV